jgi:hypothetical protein
MNKTLKIARPKFPRNANGPSGRVEHDARGNAIWTRSRAEDAAAIPEVTSSLAILNESSVKLPRPKGKNKR